jgi:hypothetical protein
MCDDLFSYPLIIHASPIFLLKEFIPKADRRCPPQIFSSIYGDKKINFVITNNDTTQNNSMVIKPYYYLNELLLI